MNLIANCCIVGDLCENKHIQYFTPFVWNTFFPDDIKVLLKEYKNIDFTKIQLVKFKDTKYYGLRIDDKLTVYYIHYLYADHDGLKRDNYLKEVTGRDIETYIVVSDQILFIVNPPNYLPGSCSRNSKYVVNIIQE